MIEEQPPSSPSNGTPAAPPPSEVPASRPAPAQRAGGCLGRFISALLVVIITTFLALAIGAIGLLYLGFTPATPQQLGDAQLQLATLQAQNASLQTQVVAQEQRGSTDHEVLGDLKREVTSMADLRDRLRQERESSAIQSATLVADVRASRDSVALFATAEAGRAALLAELERRSVRVERFLQRLGDIANDTALDLGNATPVIPTLTPTPVTSTQQVTSSPAATGSPTPSPTALPSPSPSAEATAIPTSAPSRTPSPTPRTRTSSTATSAPTATLGR